MVCLQYKKRQTVLLLQKDKNERHFLNITPLADHSASQ